MKIKSMKELGNPVTVRKLIEDYKNENGEIRCFGGKLNPRPSYQREYVYDDKNKQEVFKTLHRSFPLGTFYWCDNGNGEYEIIDGQQRTLSIMDIVQDSVYLEKDGEHKFFSDLPDSTQEMILDQELNVFLCSGDPSEKMDWFETINIAGKALASQEIRSAVYSCPFVTDARKWFVSDNGGRPQAVLNEYGEFVKGAVDRQEILEKVLYWHADAEGYTGDKDTMIRNYLRKRKTDPETYKDANDLWKYYDAVIKWAIMLFKDKGHNYEKYQQQVEWGLLYNKYHSKQYTPADIQAKVNKLMENSEIEKKAGIYEYIFDGQEKHLSPRAFKDSDKTSKYEEQQHKCATCGKEIKTIKDGHADHIRPWSKGGRTEYDNLQILCVDCNLAKSNKEKAEAITEYSAFKEDEEKDQ